MSLRKHDRYVLWLRWNGAGRKQDVWAPWMICQDVKRFPCENPRKFLREWVDTSFVGKHWDRASWKILPIGERP